VANLTLAINDGVLRQARIRALEQGTSVNTLVRDYLESYVAGSRQRSVRARLIELSDRIDAGSGATGRSWTREQLYEDRLGSAR
jgi:plasmid stability protein